MSAIRSFAFGVWLYGAIVIFGMGLFALSFVGREPVIAGVRVWARTVLFGLRWICGVKVEVRGLENMPEGGCLLASKHQSMLDTIAPWTFVKDLDDHLKWIKFSGASWLPDGSGFAISVSSGKWTDGSYSNPQLWGAWGTSPSSVVTGIEASRNKERLFIPFSAYADLADPQTCALRLTGKNVELEIVGGTGGNSYRAVLVFAGGRYLSSRRVMSSVAPKDASETTRYFVIP